jgi:Ser/Thr protein kinase RdoA (MazF antagonist)
MGDRAFLLLGYRELRPVDLESQADASAAGQALAALLTAMAALPPEVGTGDEGHPWGEIDQLLTALAPSTDSMALEVIDRYVTTLRASQPTDPLQLVHGDAHRVNVAYGESGIVWLDFEDANRRPLAWDLATLLRSWPAAGSAACQRLGIDPSEPTMVWHHDLREVYALLWAMYAGQCYQRASDGAKKRLTAWLDQHR